MTTLSDERRGTASAPLAKAPQRIGPQPQLTARGDRKFRPDIQGLRAVAVVLVVLYHSGVPGLPGGYVGVDVFLVISGFLITRHLITEAAAGDRVSLTGFYSRRIRRLLPSALLVVLVTIVVARLCGPALQATSTASDGLFASISSLNYRLAFEGIDYLHTDAAASPLQHFWSLAVEEQFYLIWPLLVGLVVLLTRKKLRRMRTGALLVVILVIGWLSFRESVIVTPANSPLAYFSLQTRAWELAIGALIAIAVPLLSRLADGIADLLSWLGIGAIVVAALVFTDATPFPGTAAVVPVGGAALIIIAGLRERAHSAELYLGARPLQFIGNVSYGWYLWHWPAIVLAPALFGVAFGWVENLEISFLALWFAVLGYLIIERPAQRSSLSNRTWFTIGAGMTAAVAVIALVLSLVVPPSLAGLGEPAKPLWRSLSAPAITRTIIESERVLRLPENVTPTLASAAADIPETTPDGCHLNFADIRQPSCVYGDTSATRTMLLFGDSHAEQWFGALDKLAKQDGWRLVSWTKSACPVADVVLTNETLKRAYTECGTWRSEILKKIAKLGPDLVVMSQADSLGGPGYDDQKWADETAKTVASVKATSPNVVFLADTPHPVSDIPTCVAAHLDDVRACSVKVARDGYLAKRSAAMSSALASIGVTGIDPTKWFCTDSACPVVVGDTLVYRDGSHMTQQYSRSLEPVLLSALKPFLTTTGSTQ